MAAEWLKVLPQAKADHKRLGTSENRDGAEIAEQSGKQTDGY